MLTVRSILTHDAQIKTQVNKYNLVVFDILWPYSMQEFFITFKKLVYVKEHYSNRKVGNKIFLQKWYFAITLIFHFVTVDICM